MKQLVILITVILLSLFGCRNTKSKGSSANTITLKENDCTIFQNNDSTSAKLSYIQQTSSEIRVTSLGFHQLDTFKTMWSLDSLQIVKYLRNACEIDASEASDLINKNYHPFGVEANIVNKGFDEHLIITPSGVGILYNYKTEAYKFYYIEDNSFILSSRDYVDNWPVKILSKHKYFDEPIDDPQKDKFYQWYLKWELTSTQINEYFDLCQWEPRYMLNAFQNIKCGLYGEVLFNSEFYSYRLECSGMTAFYKYNKRDNEDNYGFGCFDKKGEKYIYEIGLSSDE